MPGGMQHSELTKYQSVKTNQASKSYVKYTDEQIELATRLRNLEAKQREEEQSKDSDAKKFQSILNQEVVKQRRVSKKKKQEESTNGISYMRSSLPSIKINLEKGK